MKEKLLNAIDRLDALPDRIVALQMEALTLNEEISTISNKIIDRETEIKSEINAATDDNGKKVYSNEESRKIAFLSDSKEDSELAELYESKKSVVNNLDQIKISIEALSNEQRNLRSILSVIGMVLD